MAESKPFEATPSRIARARRDGDIPRSSELSAAFALGGACVVLVAVWNTAAASAAAAIADASHGELSTLPYLILACCAVTPGLAAAVCAVLATIAVSGGVSFRQLRLEVAKLNPADGVRRIASTRTLAFAVRSFLAACIACVALLPGVRDATSLGLSGASVQEVGAATIRAVKGVLLTATILGVAFGLIDALLERLAWRRRLRMSLDEMKRDLKQSEGDPQLRNRRRAQHRALIRGSFARLSEATFVVANPGHVAVALEYRPPDVAVPRVLLRAVDAGAQLVKTRARALGIPVVEDVVLARTLLATTSVDEVIPRACYLAVARIVAALLRGAEAE